MERITSYAPSKCLALYHKLAFAEAIMTTNIEPKSAQVFDGTNGRVQVRPIAGKTAGGNYVPVMCSEDGILAVETSASSAGFGWTLAGDSVETDTTNALYDLFLLKLAGTLVQTIKQTYSDITKETAIKWERY